LSMMSWQREGKCLRNGSRFVSIGIVFLGESSMFEVGGQSVECGINL
jgi:hypothetical protein